MGALPKQRISRRRRGNRRQFHTLKLPQLMTCPSCGEKKRTHHVCLNCGTYKGRMVIDVDKKRARAQED